MECLVSFDATINEVYGGYSSAAERLTVAQDVVGSIPTSRPKIESITYEKFPFSACNGAMTIPNFKREKSWGGSSIAATARGVRVENTCLAQR